MPVYISKTDEMIKRGKQIRKITRKAILKEKQCRDELTDMLACFVKKHELSLTDITFLLSAGINHIAVLSECETKKGK